MGMSLSSDKQVMPVGFSSQPHSPSRRLPNARPGLQSLLRILLATTFHLAIANARPVLDLPSILAEKDGPKSPSDPGLWIYLGTAIALVLVGGALAGLTIALMGQDEVYLQVISASGEGSEKTNATKVLKLLKKGKHWVLVTLLVGNVITNETLPIVLDRSLGGGYIAAIFSTVLVIVFGEIVPQSICVRFGLPIGAWMAPVVLVLMWVFAPITWPIAKLLDYLLGEDHGTTYKKAGLKTLVTLHKTMGTAPGERLNHDEVTIISAVLDLKAKPVGVIMTPMSDVFTLSADAVLDEVLIDKIMHEGYSRIPIYEPSNPHDFVGMLLVKMLITYDPEDCNKVTDFALATLPEARPDTSCLDIINFFQEGKSHMLLVSEYPGEPTGALGVVTLEDVIEELIGEEIIDESDVYIDIHKAIRRMQPAPIHRHFGRVAKGEVLVDSGNTQATAEEHLMDMNGQIKEDGDQKQSTGSQSKRMSAASWDQARSQVQRPQTFSTRRASDHVNQHVRQYPDQVRQQLRHLGPSNVASHPKQSNVNTVKVKFPAGASATSSRPANRASLDRAATTPANTDAKSGTSQDVISPGLSARDGVLALRAGYGTMDRNNGSPQDALQVETKTRGVQTSATPSTTDLRGLADSTAVVTRSGSHSTLGSMYDSDGRYKSFASGNKPTVARSGSITEQVVESGGVKKLVLELSSSSDDQDGSAIADHKSERARSRPQSQPHSRTHSRGAGIYHHTAEQSSSKQDDNEAKNEEAESGPSKKKKKRRPHRKKRTGPKDGANDENQPLLAP